MSIEIIEPATRTSRPVGGRHRAPRYRTVPRNGGRAVRRTVHTGVTVAVLGAAVLLAGHTLTSARHGTERAAPEPGPSDAHGIGQAVVPPWQDASPVPAETPTVPAHRSAAPPPSARPAGQPQRLGPGSQGTQVRDLQRRLRQLRLYVGPLNGTYGTDVTEAVTRIQQARALNEPLGVYGPLTRSVVEAETAA
ncbi:peptidoglycan-binding protein [Streptomyces sp. NPDC050095]|uniref:peptidoglycan-binding protein n=1 Tax=unclassified Streptomyces TaxID=2593676 RepID=UPI0034151C36